jgi:hypothetical protein
MDLWTKLSKALFGGSSQRDEGLYFYVRLYNLPNTPTDNDEIVKLRVHPQNDISHTDDGDYFVRKLVVGTKQFKRAEVTLYFDAQKKLKNQEVTGGELVKRADYEASLLKLN